MPVWGGIPGWNDYFGLTTPVPVPAATPAPIIPIEHPTPPTTAVSWNIDTLNALLLPYSPFPPSLCTYLPTILFLSLLIYTAYLLLRLPNQISRHRSSRSEQVVQTWIWKRQWRTTSFAPFFGLVEYYVRDLIPWGPWDRDPVATQFPDKQYLALLSRMGIVPLHIQDGGFGNYKWLGVGERKPWWDRSAWWWTLLPLWVQSRRRAYFVFVVLYPSGFAQKSKEDSVTAYDAARKRFLKFLRYQWYYGVACHIRNPRAPRGQRDEYKSWMNAEGPLYATPLEIGAVSWFKWLLPFKADALLDVRDARKYKDWTDVVDYRYLSKTIARSEAAFVHVEAFHWGRDRIDEWVYKQAVRAGLEDLWTEERRVGDWRGHLRAYQGLRPLPVQDDQTRE
ncbi:hypothetical protein BDV96DRAFT_597993 [Lophiotrema nucula]|uniref:Uncharacterized protein n=1 Tax=Lophiotrema nucula TaxID=690887 RepID=A0A6A5ZE90_9PLEO|nr:hypothetical protein BDV96DRAFT_597993 [Lophiotrema nucula]